MLMRETEEVEKDDNIVLDYDYCMAMTMESRTTRLIEDAREHIKGAK